MEVEPRIIILPPEGRVACFSNFSTAIGSFPVLARIAGSERYTVPALSHSASADALLRNLIKSSATGV